MSEHQRVVEGIKAALANAISGSAQELDELARSYDAACREVNDRLLRCADYLQRGLRGEAIEAAECPPNLLDMFAMLDIPEAAQWEHACAKLGLPRAPRLLVNPAQELSEAYAQQKPIEGLLIKLRLMALLRAPVKERLEVLRELARADPSSPCWDQDVRIFEEHRLRQMKQEAISAVRRRDLDKVERLNQELGKNWRVRLDDDLTVNLKRAGEAFSKEAAIATLRDLAPQLSEAYGAMAHGQVKELMQRWREVVRESEVEVPEDLIAQMRPINRWMEERNVREERSRRVEEQCIRLMGMIDAGRSMEELAREHAMLVGMHEEIPDDLEQRYRKRVEEEDRRKRDERRQHRIFLLMVLAAGLVTILVMVWVVVKMAGK
jgi:hypothetical protein